MATAARKNSNSKSWSAKETIWRRRPQTGTILPFAPTRCGPVGGAELDCGRIEIEAPESTKNFRLFLESCRKIRFFVGKVDIAVTNPPPPRAPAGWDRTGGGGEVWAGRRPISFPGRSSPPRTCGPCCRNGSGRSTDHRCGRPWLPPGWASGGGRICRRRLVYRLRVKSVTSVAEAYTTRPDKEKTSKVLYIYLAWRVDRWDNKARYTYKAPPPAQ